jgi:hypothetical protein
MEKFKISKLYSLYRIWLIEVRLAQNNDNAMLALDTYLTAASFYLDVIVPFVKKEFPPTDFQRKIALALNAIQNVVHQINKGFIDMAETVSKQLIADTAVSSPEVPDSNEDLETCSGEEVVFLEKEKVFMLSLIRKIKVIKLEPIDATNDTYESFIQKNDLMDDIDFDAADVRTGIGHILNKMPNFYHRECDEILTTFVSQLPVNKYAFIFAWFSNITTRTSASVAQLLVSYNADTGKKLVLSRDEIEILESERLLDGTELYHAVQQKRWIIGDMLELLSETTRPKAALN